jgi:hypothetical protein
MNDLPKKPIYEIRVKGRLADHFLKWFEGLSFEYREGDTYIVGPVPDQPALQGMLVTLGDLGLTLQSVRCLSEE